jgi:hypothetical protein
MADNEWKAADFNRRSYTIAGDDLDKAKRIAVTITVDGKQIMNAQLREPGMIALVSKPSEQGFDVEIVEPGGARFTDFQTPEGDNRTPQPEHWQLVALGLEKR